jgi:serine protease Do
VRVHFISPATLRHFATKGAACVALALPSLTPYGTCAAAEQLAPQLQQQLRAATFEVVVRKPKTDNLAYEKPLPLELMPEAERNDRYRSLGMAFAIGANTFVSGARAMMGIGPGTPGIRAADGAVYAVQRVLKYHSNQDFVVFSVVNPPHVAVLPTRTAAVPDEAVFAVGNVPGEGFVLREGQLTSMTPEAQAGRWQWLRFTAASPGSGGGPLLDAQGRVIGVVRARSPNETLNYALPIELVLNAPEKSGTFQARDTFGVPQLMPATVVSPFEESFALPLPFAQFSERVHELMLKHFRISQQRLVAANSERLFPKGNSATLLATLYDSTNPALVVQQEDGSWDVHGCEGEIAPLGGDGEVWHCRQGGAGLTLFRISYATGDPATHRYSDSKQFIELLLRGIRLPRLIGQQSVRITSLGRASEDVPLRDHYGRTWQLRTWPLGFVELNLMSLALPTPDGYVGMASVVPNAVKDLQAEQLKFIADYLYLTYRATLPQWQAFLANQAVRPAALAQLQLRYSGGALQLQTPRLRLDSAGLVHLDDQSLLDLQMHYILEGDQLSWDAAGVMLRPDPSHKGYLGLYRQARPDAQASPERQQRWQHMNERTGEFSGTLQQDDAHSEFWLRTVVHGARAAPLYEVVYATERPVTPQELEQVRARLSGSIKISE